MMVVSATSNGPKGVAEPPPKSIGVVESPPDRLQGWPKPLPMQSVSLVDKMVIVVLN
jgi:hypothetical protein